MRQAMMPVYVLVSMPLAIKATRVVLAAITALVVVGAVAAGLPRALGLRTEALGQRLVLAEPVSQALPGDEVLFTDESGSTDIYHVLGLQRSGSRQTLILAGEDGKPLPTPVAVSGEVLVVRSTVPLLGYGHRLMNGWAGRTFSLLVLAGALVWLYRLAMDVVAPASGGLRAAGLTWQGAHRGIQALETLASALRHEVTSLGQRLKQKQEGEMHREKPQADGKRTGKARSQHEDEEQSQDPAQQPEAQPGPEAAAAPSLQVPANGDGPSDVLEQWPSLGTSEGEEESGEAAAPAFAQASQAGTDGEGGQEESPLDSDLMAIFQKVASQVRERTLAAEVEDVPLSELLEELRAVRQRLRA